MVRLAILRIPNVPLFNFSNSKESFWSFQDESFPVIMELFLLLCTLRTIVMCHVPPIRNHHVHRNGLGFCIRSALSRDFFFAASALSSLTRLVPKLILFPLVKVNTITPLIVILSDLSKYCCPAPTIHDSIVFLFCQNPSKFQPDRLSILSYSWYIVGLEHWHCTFNI